MPKMRERCASFFASRKARRALRHAISLLFWCGPSRALLGLGFWCGPSRALRGLAVALAVLATNASSARAATRRIALIHAEAELSRSVDLALYPWDITVIVVDETPPDATGPSGAARARSIARRYGADAVAWIERSDGESAQSAARSTPGAESAQSAARSTPGAESAQSAARSTPAAGTTLWFFDAADDSLHSRHLPPSPREDPAELAAVALTLKTLVRATPWESRLRTVVRDRKGPGWETRLELDVLARVPVAGASGEPRLGLWVSEWYGPSRLMVGAALGASAGLGMTFDNPTAHGSLQDIDLRGALRLRFRPARPFLIEPKLGCSAHVERAEVATSAPATTGTFTRVDPSIDFGLALGWQVTEGFAWSLGIEALESIRYQRWLEGQEVVFAPSPLWIQGGSSIAWSFR